jgi:hypothetical protein
MLKFKRIRKRTSKSNKLQEVMEQAEAQKAKIEIVMFHKKVSDLGAFFFVLVNHDF